MHLSLYSVVQAKRTSTATRNNRAKQPRQQLHATRIECETTSPCIDLIPEESMNCIFECTSSACYQEIYGSSPLEDGEIDIARASEFAICAEKEIKRNRKLERLERRGGGNTQNSVGDAEESSSSLEKEDEGSESEMSEV